MEAAAAAVGPHMVSPGEMGTATSSPLCGLSLLRHWAGAALLSKSGRDIPVDPAPFPLEVNLGSLGRPSLCI